MLYFLRPLQFFKPSTPGGVLPESYPTMSIRLTMYRWVILSLFHVNPTELNWTSARVVHLDWLHGVHKGLSIDIEVSRLAIVCPCLLRPNGQSRNFNIYGIITYLLHWWVIFDCSVTAQSTFEWNWKLPWRKKNYKKVTPRPSLFTCKLLQSIK